MTMPVFLSVYVWLSVCLSQTLTLNLHLTEGAAVSHDVTLSGTRLSGAGTFRLAILGRSRCELGDCYQIKSIFCL